MNKKHIQIGVDTPDNAFNRFINKWNELEKGQDPNTEIHFNFEDFTMFMSVLTPKRIHLLRALKKNGPLSIRSLAKLVERDYKNVHVDVTALISTELIKKDEAGLLFAPWDVIDAHVQLVA